MRNTSTQVLGFYSRQVALPGPEKTAMRERRNANRSRLKLGLDANNKPKPYGQWSQGSYAMHTMIQDADNDYDIDDGAYFHKDDLVGPQGGEMSALDVRQMVCDALQDDRFAKAPEHLKNCVRVYYNEGFHVDVPSYRRFVDKDPWSGAEVEKFELASADWKVSDPREVTKWFKRQNRALSYDCKDTEGQFLRIVKLLKAFARSRSSWKGQIATGFMITKLASEHFDGQADRDDLAFRITMKNIEARLKWQKDIEHPTLHGEEINHADDARPEFLRARLEENLKHLDVLDEPNCSHADAMSAWDRLFSTDWFSGQPDPDDGEKATVGSAGGPTAPVQKRGGGRYGRFG